MADPRNARPFTLHEITGWSLIQITAWRPPELGAVVAVAYRMSVPQSVGDVIRDGCSTLIRIAPDRVWLVDDGRAAAEIGPVSAAGCITSLTEGRSRFRLGGVAWRDVLAKCVAIDWEEPNAAPGRTVQTMLHRVPVLIHRLGGNACDLFVPRSFEVSLRECIDDAARQFVAERAQPR